MVPFLRDKTRKSPVVNFVQHVVESRVKEGVGKMRFYLLGK